MDNFRRRLLSQDVNPIGVFIYTTDGSLITSSKWVTSGKNLSDVIGIAVLTEDHKFVIAPENLGSELIASHNRPCPGLLGFLSSEEARQRFNGYEDTRRMANAYGGFNSNPASAALVYLRGGKSWYLPSCGEFCVAYNNKAAIDAAMSACGATAMNLHGAYWTSTYYYNNKVNTYGFYTLDWYLGYTSWDSVTESNYARPFCAF